MLLTQLALIVSVKDQPKPAIRKVFRDSHGHARFYESRGLGETTAKK